MPTVVIPFAGEGKTRLHASPEIRRLLSEAMLADVMAACDAVGTVRLVTTRGGQGGAVASALADVAPGPVLIVNADVPCVTPDDVRALFAAGTALVEAADGTTNALSLPGPDAFAPLYGAGSADRFRAHFAEVGIECVTLGLPNLADDVDTLEDLQRVLPRCGGRTRAAFERIPAGAAA
jgi:2-phospho-L-lactate/phosphoenolpyruvate guanylyltransferase